jgi:hypothetical protein
MSTTGTLATNALHKITHHGKPTISINFDSPEETYTTGDTISGHVSITAPHATRFDDVYITLEGQASTHVVNMTPVASHSHIEANHPFLKLRMPIPESAYPTPRIAEPGRTYAFPFTFVVPARLVDGSCRHSVSSDHVQAQHLSLPPSMGDSCHRGSANGTSDGHLDDLSPEMARISYTIRVRVTRTRERDAKAVLLAEGSQKVRIVPVVPEAPPMHIAPEDKEYVLSVTKTLKKGILFGGKKWGKVTVSAEQTKALAVHTPSSSIPSTRSVSTSSDRRTSINPAGHSSSDAADAATLSPTPTIMANLHLNYVPSGPDAQPPRLGTLTSKIRASTFFAISPQRELATRASHMLSYDLSRGVYSTSVQLPQRCVSNVRWTYVPPTSATGHKNDVGSGPPSLAKAGVLRPERRDSGYSTCSSSSSSCTPTAAQTQTFPARTGSTSSASSSSTDQNHVSRANEGFWTASIPLPLALPPSKTWLPTFHSCLVSRVYTLELALQILPPQGTGPSLLPTEVKLKLPVQVATAGSDGGSESFAGSGGDEAVVVGGEGEEEVEGYFRSRVLSVPAQEYIGTSSLPRTGAVVGVGEMPPVYS